MKKGEPKDCLLWLFLSMAFCLFVGYGWIFLGGCEMNLCGKIFATVMLVFLIGFIWCCKDCWKEEKDLTNYVKMKSSSFSFSMECDGKIHKVNIKDFRTVPEENSKEKTGEGK